MIKMGSLIDKIKAKLREVFANYKYHDYLKFLDENQFNSRKRIVEHQEKRLRELIEFAFQHIEFYKEFSKKNNIAPKNIRTLEDLKKLPVMSKQKYRTLFPEKIVDPDANEEDLYLNSTSGSTGTPFKFYNSKELRGHKAARSTRFYRWANCEFGDPMVKIWGISHLGLKKKIYHKFFKNQLLINAFNLNRNNFHNYYKKIKKKEPILLEAYTSSAYAFSLILEENNLELNIPSTILSGETLFDFQKELIEEKFNTEIYNRYGCREFGAIAQHCSHHTGLHINEEDFIIEIIDDNHQTVEKGTTGNIVVTCLNNYVMPFIRYKMDDLGSFLEKECPCGRKLKMLKTVEGRVTDMIYSPSGKHISLYFFALTFQGLNEYVNEFQVVQKKGSKQLIIKIVPTEEYNHEVEKRIKQEINEMDNAFNINIDLVDKIPLEPNGKKKYLKKI